MNFTRRRTLVAPHDPDDAAAAEAAWVVEFSKQRFGRRLTVDCDQDPPCDATATVFQGPQCSHIETVLHIDGGPSDCRVESEVAAFSSALRARDAVLKQFNITSASGFHMASIRTINGTMSGVFIYPSVSVGDSAIPPATSPDSAGVVNSLLSIYSALLSASKSAIDHSHDASSSSDLFGKVLRDDSFTSAAHILEIEPSSLCKLICSRVVRTRAEQLYIALSTDAVRESTRRLVASFLACCVELAIARVLRQQSAHDDGSSRSQSHPPLQTCAVLVSE